MADQNRCGIHGTYTGNTGCPFCKRASGRKTVEVLSTKPGEQGGVSIHSKSSGRSDPSVTPEVRESGVKLRVSAEDEFEYRKGQ